MAFELPKLSYAVDALEPYIDAQTMTIHHDKHHQAYVTNLNGAIEKHPELAGKSIEDGRCVVDLEVWCENQRGEVSAPGSARVILPSRAGGEVKLPESSGKDDVPLIY